MIAVALMAALAPESIILDTDSGFFNDDGAALVMLVRSPEQVRVQAITIVPGNVWPEQGAEYMFYTQSLLGTIIPIHLGARTPLVHNAAMSRVAARRWGPLEFMGAFAEPPDKVAPPFGGEFTGRTPDKRNAVDVIGSARDATLLAIGPLTNIAMALRLAPDLPTRIRRLIIMGGAVRVKGNVTKRAEFNFWFDPEAAQIVLRSPIQEKVLFALDATNQAPVTRADFDALTADGTPLSALIREDMGNRYPAFLRDPKATGYLWDTLAAAYLLDPTIAVETQNLHLDVETKFGPDYGRVKPLDRSLAPDATPVRFVSRIDAPRARALHLRLLTGTKARSENP